MELQTTNIIDLPGEYDFKRRKYKNMDHLHTQNYINFYHQHHQQQENIRNNTQNYAKFNTKTHNNGNYNYQQPNYQKQNHYEHQESPKNERRHRQNRNPNSYTLNHQHQPLQCFQNSYSQKIYTKILNLDPYRDLIHHYNFYVNLQNFLPHTLFLLSSRISTSFKNHDAQYHELKSSNNSKPISRQIMTKNSSTVPKIITKCNNNNQVISTNVCQNHQSKNCQKCNNLKIKTPNCSASLKTHIKTRLYPKRSHHLTNLISRVYQVLIFLFSCNLFNHQYATAIYIKDVQFLEDHLDQYHITEPINVNHLGELTENQHVLHPLHPDNANSSPNSDTMPTRKRRSLDYNFSDISNSNITNDEADFSYSDILNNFPEASDYEFNRYQYKSNHHYKRQAKNLERLEQEPEHLNFYNITLQDGKTLTLELKNKPHILGPNASFMEHDSETLNADSENQDTTNRENYKSKKNLAIPDGTYTGKVKFYPNSRVTITSYDNNLAGIIILNMKEQGQEYYLQPIKNSHRHVIYQTENLKNREIKEQNCLLGPKVEKEKLKIQSQNIEESIKNRSKRSVDLGYDHPFDLQPVFEHGVDSYFSNTYSNTGSSSSGYAAAIKSYYIEVMVAADQSVINFHGIHDLQPYIVTLMNIVDDIYQHESLGVNVKIVLVDIVFVRLNLIVYQEAQRSLNSICSWASNHDRRNQYDMTIFLTREDFGPAGFAPVKGMCDFAAGRSCSLNREEGFGSAFVIAHEMGHVLGMEHDGENGNPCRDAINYSSVMAPVVKSNFRRYEWSRCSKITLQRRIHQFRCLHNSPNWKDWGYRVKYPGQLYSSDDQCQFDFGSSFTVCKSFSYKDPCTQLWCADNRNSQFCKTKKGVPLDGTVCGHYRFCFKGRCVYNEEINKSPTIRQPIHGGWSDWSGFDTCSRTCDVGIQIRTRSCNNPVPKYGGKDCAGPKTDPRTCNTHPCRSNNGKIKLVDFRQEQCSRRDNSVVHGNRFHSWLAVEPTKLPNNLPLDGQCQLFCSTKASLELVDMGLHVEDGTRCSYLNPYGICAQGHCLDMGCDNVINSGKRYNKCGICGGNRNQCIQIVDRSIGVPNNKISKAKTGKKGYYKINSNSTRSEIFIPKTARNIVIYTTKPSKYTLSLKNNNKKGSKSYFLRTSG